jgi:multidrug efflux system membrane fusion protein
MGASGLVRYSASIVPYEQVSLAFKVGGYISEVRQVRGADGRMRNLQEGDRVKRGAVLARVRQSDYREAVNRAQGSLAEDQASFEKARLDYERAERLFQSQSLTKADYDAARAAYDAGKARVDAARAQLAEAEISLHDTALVAPSDAVVLDRKIELGTLVSAGTVGFVVADTSSVKVVFGVPDRLVQRVRLGMTLPVIVEGIGGQSFPGQVTAIAPEADPSSRVFDIELTLRNAKDLLKPGMIATVVVRAEDLAAAQAEAGALLVPLSAIVKPTSEGQFAVFVVEGSGEKQVARLRPVELSEVHGNMVAVSKGLTKGEQVVTTGASLLVDGETVRIIP